MLSAITETWVVYTVAMTTKRGEVVDDRQREQEHPDPSSVVWGVIERHRRERERRVGRHRRPPAVPAGAAGIECQVDQNRHRDAAYRSEHGDCKAAPLAQLPEVEARAWPRATTTR